MLERANAVIFVISAAGAAAVVTTTVSVVARLGVKFVECAAVVVASLGKACEVNIVDTVLVVVTEVAVVDGGKPELMESERELKITLHGAGKPKPTA